MKSVLLEIVILCFSTEILISCHNITEKTNGPEPAINATLVTDESHTIVLLKEKTARQTLLSQIDSWCKHHEEPFFNNDIKGIFPQINEALLVDLIESIDLKALKTNNRYHKSYHFNVPPKGYIDSKECLDNISIEFNKRTKSFLLSMSSSFHVGETQACSEHQTFYQFSITNDKITLLNISAAG
jgi:hypothetical protein